MLHDEIWWGRVPGVIYAYGLSGQAVERWLAVSKGGGTGGDGGDMSPPIFETGAFVPPKNYTAKYLIFKYFRRCMPPTEPLRQRAGLGAVGG